MIADLSKLGLSPEQIAARRNGIGGSDATTIMGGDPVKLAKLWEEKTGRREPDDLSDVLCVQLGSCTEPFNAAWYQKITGHQIICRNLPRVHHEIEWWRSNLDGIVLVLGGKPAVWEAKHVSGWEEILDIVVPRYTPQVYHNMHAAGCKRGILSIIVGTSALQVFEFEHNPMYLARLIERETEFWEYVQQDCPPPEWLDIAPPPPVTDFRCRSRWRASRSGLRPPRHGCPRRTSRSTTRSRARSFATWSTPTWARRSGMVSSLRDRSLGLC